MISFVHSALISVFVMADAATELQMEEHKRMEACLAKIETMPEEAYEDGLAWQSEANRAYARHCTALSLIELGHIEEGAARLEDLANATDGGSIQQRALYLTQSGNAWLLARRPEAAELTLSNAIKLSPQDPALYLDRARARYLLENWFGADADATEALSYNVNNVDALKVRIKSRLELGETQLAYQDLQVALQLAPKDIDVLVLRGEVRQAQDKDKAQFK
jgi:tetratricopeptide (TPR) repeat protein